MTSCNKACRDLCEACHFGHFNCVKYFINYNSDDIKKNPFFNVLLTIVIIITIQILLLRRDINYNQSGGKLNETP
jgi:hypothetical protein